MSALVAGSMVPDFQYFILMKISGRFSHSPAGIFIFDFPVTILLLLVFHLVVKEPLIDSLPKYFSSRLRPLKSFDFIRYAKEHAVALVLCVFTGILSHIIWDGFTHSNGWFSGMVPGLLIKLNFLNVFNMPLYGYLQHGSTIIGAIFIAIVFHRMPKQVINQKSAVKFWILILIFFILAFLIRSLWGIGQFGELVVVSISSGFIALLAASVIVNAKANKT